MESHVLLVKIAESVNAGIVDCAGRASELSILMTRGLEASERLSAVTSGPTEEVSDEIAVLINKLASDVHCALRDKS